MGYCNKCFLQPIPEVMVSLRYVIRRREYLIYRLQNKVLFYNDNVNNLFIQQP